MTSGEKATAASAPKPPAKERTVVPPEPGSVADLYREAVPAVDFEAEQTKWDVALTVPPEQLHHILKVSRDHPTLRMDLLRNQTAVDWLERGLEVIYHLYSTSLYHSVAIKTWVPAENPSLPTITDLWAMAEWAERECREMFGIAFQGHPDPRNLLLDEDFDIPVLRKSHPLAPIELKQGVDVEYFTKTHPRQQPPAAEETATAPVDDERARRIAEAKKRAEAAVGGKAEAKPAADLTPEELTAKKAAQAERVQRGRELAAARRAEGGPPKAGTKAVAAEASVAEAPAAVAPAAPAKPAAPAPAAAEKKATADMTPEEREAKKAAQADRVARARELAAQRRAEKEAEG